MSLKPLIVLVHGALTDASVWNSVAEHRFRPAPPIYPLHLRGASRSATPQFRTFAWCLFSFHA